MGKRVLRITISDAVEGMDAEVVKKQIEISSEKDIRAFAEWDTPKGLYDRIVNACRDVIVDIHGQPCEYCHKFNCKIEHECPRCGAIH